MGKRTPMPVRIVHDEPMRAERPADSKRVNIRQIKNGFIVNEHGHRNGKYYDDEYFTPHVDLPGYDKQAPRREPAKPSGGRGGDGGRAARLGRTKI